jgi:hypothetical protein
MCPRRAADTPTGLPARRERTLPIGISASYWTKSRITSTRVCRLDDERPGSTRVLRCDERRSRASRAGGVGAAEPHARPTMVIVRRKRPVSSRILLTILRASAPPTRTPVRHGDREEETARFEPDPPHDLARAGALDRLGCAAGPVDRLLEGRLVPPGFCCGCPGRPMLRRLRHDRFRWSDGWLSAS